MKRDFVRQVVVFEDHFKEFRKKTQKTPVEQLDRAEALMKKYFEQKNVQENGK